MPKARSKYDPCLIRDRDVVYVFSTDPHILVRRSRDAAQT